MELIHALAEWVLAWSDTPYAGVALFLLAFVESSFFPIPPDALLIAMSAGNIQFAFGFAAITTAGSLAGAVLGYYIGLKGGRPLLDRMFDERKVLFVERQYRQRDVWAVVIAGLHADSLQGLRHWRRCFPARHAAFSAGFRDRPGGKVLPRRGHRDDFRRGGPNRD